MIKSKGSLQQKHGTWYVVVSYKDEFGKPKQKWISTNLRVSNNKTLAKEEMKRILSNENLKEEVIKPIEKNNDIYFVDFIKSFLNIKKQTLEPVTYSAYLYQVDKICQYFNNTRLKLKEIKPYHIEGFYKTLYENGLCGNTVLHYHIVIRECLQYAFKNEFIDINVADRIDRPKTEGYKANFYTIEEIQKLFECIKEHECRLPIMLTAMYGFRRSEVLGLKWNAIDFENKLIHVQHKVIETQADGKRFIYQADKMKTKTSHRTLPLLPQAEELLLKQKEQIEKNKQNLGKCYNNRYLDYICVDSIGRLILPNRLSTNFIKIIKTNKLKHIRFHDLRHSCASIMLANNVPMKQIQEWLGHADFGTTANIYSHLDYKTKQNSANTISNVFSFVESIPNDKTEDIKEVDKTIELENRIKELQEQLLQQQKENEIYLDLLSKTKKKQMENDGPEM